MKGPKYTVTLPNSKGSGFIGYHTFYNIRFENGVAHGVTLGTALDEFKDWGCVVELENPADTPKPLTEAEVEMVAKKLANAHKRARRTAPKEEDETPEDEAPETEDAPEASDADA